MALKPKFRISWIILSAVFISLSVSSADQQTEGHKCFWCGPLAEQVHRSQRAAKCSGDKSKVTVCDEDLPYCAIVAKSPPYVESRYCVKSYQDECYTLYCSTTKTWKVTCPCRGELCNGINTLRENEAFKALKHNISEATQNFRFKRAMEAQAGFFGITARRNKTDNMTTSAQNGTIGNIIETENLNNITIVDPDPEKNIDNVTNMIAKLEDTPESPHDIYSTTATVHNLSSIYTNTEVIFIDSLMATSESAPVDKEADNTLENNLIQTKTTSTETTTENNYNARSESTKQIDIPSDSIISSDLKTEIIIKSSEVPKLVNDAIATELFTKLEDITATTEPTLNKVVAETTTSVTKITEVNIDTTKSRPIKNLPSANALQHNDTPVIHTYHMFTTTTNLNMPTEETKPQNGTAVQIDTNIIHYALGITIILYL